MSGTAVSPEDFPSSPSATVTFNTGDDSLTTRNVVIPVADDNIIEPTQSFQVSIISADNVVSPGTATVFIQDNDGTSSKILFVITSNNQPCEPHAMYHHVSRANVFLFDPNLNSND